MFVPGQNFLLYFYKLLRALEKQSYLHQVEFFLGTEKGVIFYCNSRGHRTTEQVWMSIISKVTETLSTKLREEHDIEKEEANILRRLGFNVQNKHSSEGDENHNSPSGIGSVNTGQ